MVIVVALAEARRRLSGFDCMTSAISSGLSSGSGSGRPDALAGRRASRISARYRRQTVGRTCHAYSAAAATMNSIMGTSVGFRSARTWPSAWARSIRLSMAGRIRSLAQAAVADEHLGGALEE